MFTITVIIKEDYVGANEGDYGDYGYDDDYDDDVSSTIGDDGIRQYCFRGGCSFWSLAKKVVLKVIVAKKCNGKTKGLAK